MTQKQSKTVGIPATEKGEAAYSREQLLSSKRYAERRDLLSALLLDSREYTCGEVDSMIDHYEKGRVR